MRKVARISLISAGGANELQSAWSKIADWIRTKCSTYDGESDWKADFVNSDSRPADLNVRGSILGDFLTRGLVLSEQTQGGVFRTAISLATNGQQVSLLCDLEAGRPGHILAPAKFEARIPQVLRKIIHGGSWHCGANPVAVAPLSFRGSADGGSLATILLHSDRSLPVVVVAELGGKVLGETTETDSLARQAAVMSTDTRLAADLAGVAIVARVDADASFGLADAVGKELSCFNGGLRIYWPGFTRDSYFRDHPLWTYGGLLGRSGSPSQADKNIRGLIRRRVLAVSTFSLQPHAPHRDAEQAELKARLHELREGRNASELEAYFEQLVAEQERLAGERDEALELAARMETRASNAEAQLRYFHSGEVGNDTLQEEVAPPQTVVEALERARSEFSEDLCFGGRVSDSSKELAADAGPPEKIFLHLSQLAQMARTLRSDGALGLDPIRWLNKRGVTSSGEGNLSHREQQKRTWPDGCGATRMFSLHTKPTDGTDPAHCVRIYFEVAGEGGKVIVGWVGRHP